MKTLLLDMYGVIIEESKGNFAPYVYSQFPFTDKTFYRNLYVSASKGEINSNEFFETLGFTDTEGAKRDYIENHLTLDPAFHSFADNFSAKYNFVLLSNDVLAWSEYIREHYDIGKYFKVGIISANTGLRKPDVEIFRIALERLDVEPQDCIFVDNSVENLNAAASIGISTILFNRDGENYDGTTVYSFEELGELL
jgi:putative hydrolase of the HAD superfamily